jgi:hypothetical protein
MVTMQEFMKTIFEGLSDTLSAIPGSMEEFKMYVTAEQAGNVIGGLTIFISELLEPLTKAITAILPGLINTIGAVMDITMENETVNTAYHEFTNAMSENITTIAGPANASYGLTYMLNGTMELFTNEEMYTYAGSRLLISLFDAIVSISSLLADAMYALPQMFPWG